MTLSLSIAQMLANLETKVALHKERKHFRAEQEAIDREPTALHAARLDNALARLEARASEPLESGGGRVHLPYARARKYRDTL